MEKLKNLPGSRLVRHAVLVAIIGVALVAFTNQADPLVNFDVANIAMYAIALFGMVVLVGLSGQVSLGNGAFMLVGGYAFALTSLNWKTVPFLGVPMNAVWSMVFAGLFGVAFGLVVGGIAARLRGPYLAGLTLGVAVGFPAVINRFPNLFGGDSGLALTVPFPEGGYEESASVNYEDELGERFDETIEDLPEDQAPLDESSDVEELSFDDFADEGEVEELTLDDLQGGDEDVVEELTLDDLEELADVEEPIAEESFETEDFSEVEDEEFFAGDELGGLEGVLDPNAVLQFQASMAIIVAVIAGFFALNLVRGRQGRVWRAVRDDPIAAAVSGIFPAGSKVSAFVVSSLFAALAGAVFAQIQTNVGPGTFPLGLSLFLLVGVILGGRTSLLGAVIGAAILVLLDNFVRDVTEGFGWPTNVINNAPDLLYGLLVVLVVLIAPGGIVGTVGEWLGKIRRRKAVQT
jgi:ABC-type branched-subunit amino acid transport system permease subunit